MTPGAVLLGVVVLIAGAVALGTQVGSTRTLTRPSSATASADYARNAIGRLAPVSAQFTEKRLGRDVAAGLPKVRPAPNSDITRGPGPAPVKRDESIHGEPGTIPGLAPGGFVLTLAMAPNRLTVHAGDEVRYRMIVANTGNEDFRGRAFTLEWHTPTGTIARNGLEQCTLLPIALIRGICSAQRIIVQPGLGEARHNSFNTAGLVAIRPGEQWTHDWFVQVLPTAPDGTTYLNHAHLMVSINGQDHTISSDDVTVTVVA